MPKYKRMQMVMVWFLPLIVIGGLFLPLLGYLVLAMAMFFLPLSFFKGRFWCWNLCPRGAFLDIVMTKLNRNRPFPLFLTKRWFRWSIFFLFISLLIFRLLRTGGNLILIGTIFVSMCILTTIISVVLAVFWRHRSWCLICPMGTLQEQLGRIGKRRKTTLL